MNNHLEENLTYFALALYQTDEKVKISIETDKAILIKPNAILFYAVKSVQQDLVLVII